MEETLGKRIMRHRKQLSLTQDQLAEQLGVTAQAVSKWENDQTAPDTIKLIQLADVLDTDVEYLATGNHSTIKAQPEYITVEKFVEKPVVVEKVVEVERIVETVVEKPVVRKVFRNRYVRNPLEYMLIGVVCFVLGFLVGHFI